jgi:hypothetical protein
VAEQYLGFEAGRVCDSSETRGSLLQSLFDVGYKGSDIGIERPGMNRRRRAFSIEFLILDFQFFFLP